MKASDIGIVLNEELNEVEKIINENDLVDRPGLIDKENFVYDIEPEDDFDEVEEGVIHFLPIVEKILNGEVNMIEVDATLPEEEFYKRYGLGIK